jgi:hypothetical protein
MVAARLTHLQAGHFPTAQPHATFAAFDVEPWSQLNFAVWTCGSFGSSAC